MGVASPFQSRKPLEYFLGGLTTSELVHMWEFLSRNLDEELDADGSRGASDLSSEDLPTAKQVRKHLYSESMPSHFYA